MRSIPSVTELCRALVRIPSENPSGAPESAGEEPLARFVGEFLSAHGATVEFEYVAEGRPNVYGWFPKPPAPKATILFAPHLDTVPARGMTIDPFSGDIVDGSILGRGATDTKGRVAAMLWALTTVDLTKLSVAVGFAGLADEEAGQLGSQVCARRREADFVVVGEPTDLNVVYTHKGTAWIQLDAKGKAVHAAAPDAGINAIELLAQAFAALGSHRIGVPWFCDAAFFAEQNPPAIAIGPGTIKQAHTCDEFIEIQDLERGADFFRSFLLGLTA